MNQEYKFEGILKNIKIESIEPERLLEILIDKNIYYHYDNSLDPPIEFFIPIESKSETEGIELASHFSFNGKEYSINPDILEEIYSKLEFYVEVIHTDVIVDALEMDISLMGFIDTTEKIEFLKSKHKQAFEFLRSLDYLIFIGKEYNGSNDWKKYVLDYIGDDEYYIRQHLKNSISDYLALNDDYCIVGAWINFHEKGNISAYCLTKLHELSYEKNTAHSTSPPNTFQALLLDSLVKIENWEELSFSKKGEILQMLTGKGKDNARKAFGEAYGKSERQKHWKTSNEIQEKLKSLGCIFKQLGV